MEIDQEMLMTLNDNLDLLKKIITSRKSWVYGYNIETKAQLPQWKSPEQLRPKITHCFLRLQCVVHHEFLPQGRKVNKV